MQMASAAMASPLAATAYAETTPSWEPKSKKPGNVIVMICDDLGFGDLGCYGGRIRTPNLDRMASGGVRCLRYNAGHPLCSASRAALLTGRYAPRSHTNPAYNPMNQTGMDLDEMTLGNVFRKAGFRTEAIGKWHLGHTDAYLPTQRGFQRFYGVPYSVDMQPLPLLRDTAVLEQDVKREQLTPLYTEEAVRFLKEDHRDPFFLYMAYSYPHDPAAASARFRGKSGLGNSGDAIAEIDWSVGQVLDTLKANNLLDDTLILFTSDHGPWFQGSPGGLRGRKGSTFEGGFRVPLLAHWPHGLPPGRTCQQWISGLDVMPTLVAFCGLQPPPKPLDGVDVTEALRSDTPPKRERALLYFSPPGGGNTIHCARQGRWKLRVAQNDGEIYVTDYTIGHDHYWLSRPELYDLESDPEESYDVAAEHSDLVSQLMQDIEQQVPTFPHEVVETFAALRKNVAQDTTPPGATPRPQSQPRRPWIYEPAWRVKHESPA